MDLTAVEYPELFFGMVGAIGTDLNSLGASLATSLAAVGYQSEVIKLTEEMVAFRSPVDTPALHSKFDEYMHKMDHANSLRKEFELADLLARIAILAIRARREKLQRDRKLAVDADKPIEKQAYIIRQIKHPEEIKLLRKVYGKQFICVSAYGSEAERSRKLYDDIVATISTNTPPADISHMASKLIFRDADEVNDEFGQHLREAYHQADLFVDGVSLNAMKLGTNRFVEVLFGKNDITPSKSEYGMYAAKSASLRSADLSRQIGAAVFSVDGELIAQGCNEVPKAGGGTYWDGELPDHRDIKKGFDPNERIKLIVLRDLIERLNRSSYLDKKKIEGLSDTAIVSNLICKEDKAKGISSGPLHDARIMDLTEYGRVVHAEMCALCDAARLGKAVKGAVLYCTTFPCHNCTKHILAAGIVKVVFIEPYPKSRAKELHENEIEMEGEGDPSRVAFMPFLGISPVRYRDLFQRAKRKLDGVAMAWSKEPPRPSLDLEFPSYPKTTEPWALAPLIGNLSADVSDQIAT